MHQTQERALQKAPELEPQTSPHQPVRGHRKHLEQVPGLTRISLHWALVLAWNRTSQRVMVLERQRDLRMQVAWPPQTPTRRRLLEPE